MIVMVEQVKPAVKARDLRANIQELGFEHGVVATLELLLEEHAANRQYIRDLSNITEKLIDNFERMVAVSDGLRRHIDALKRVQEEGEADG